MRAPGSGSAWGSLVAGLASTVTLPLAIYLTRFSDSYELVHAGFGIPLAIVLGVVSLHLARRAERARTVLLRGSGRSWPARLGRTLGVIGLSLAAAGIVALGVYALLEYAGTRD